MSKSESPSGETRLQKSWFYYSFINLYKASGLTGLFIVNSILKIMVHLQMLYSHDRCTVE